LDPKKKFLESLKAQKSHSKWPEYKLTNKAVEDLSRFGITHCVGRKKKLTNIYDELISNVKKCENSRFCEKLRRISMQLLGIKESTILFSSEL